MIENFSPYISISAFSENYVTAQMRSHTIEPRRWAKIPYLCIAKDQTAQRVERGQNAKAIALLAHEPHPAPQE
jgi:hypothetical protein